MSARWGFDLDMSAVRLMRRDGDQWQEVVRENIDGPDIEDRLMAMVDKVDDGEAVALFLPRDQILYTDVKLTTEDRHLDEIAAALDGRTPYALDELEYDWELTGPDTARVAAIAKETLDEAAAFAEARGLAVAGYGALADTNDFPRDPSFGASLGPTEEAVASPAQPEPETPPAKPKAEAPPAKPEDPSQPVLLVEDDKPVMEVRAKPMPPLDPGEPLAGMPQPPRVRTDIAAGTLSASAATLTPPKGPAIRIRESGSRPRHTLIAFAVAAVLTVGVAAIVWSILPLAPGRSDNESPSATQTGLTTEGGAPAEEVALTPDLPEPSVIAAAPSLAAPAETSETPDLPRIDLDDISRMTAVSLPDQTIDPVGLPATSQPYPQTPEGFATILTEDPVQGLDGAEDAAETTLDIYFASIERTDLAFDAIALPPANALTPSAAPLITPTPPLNAEPPGAKFVSANPRALPETAPQPETPPVETASEPEAEPGLPRPTELAAALPDRAPRARPSSFAQDIERQQFGGRTRAELARLTPPPRPESAQIIAQSDRESAEVSELAVASSLVPRNRPSDFDAIVAAAVLAARTAALAPARDYETPDTRGAVAAALAEELEPEDEPGTRPQDTPRLVIPSNTSVSRQATIDNAIRLNQINLVGVYGVPSDRRALIRLPSGRYVKVKVGDRVDGGTVAQINDSELIYRKGSRTLSLAMPKG